MGAKENRSARSSRSILSKAGSIVGGGLVFADSYSRMKAGQSAVTAVPAALISNAVYSAMPGGYIGAGVLMGAQLAPQIIDTLNEGNKRHNKNKRMFNGYYQENDAQLAALSRGMDRMNQARGARSSQMMNHAKGRVQSY